MYKTLVEHHVFAYKGQLYCSLCKSAHLNLRRTVQHFSESMHVALKNETNTEAVLATLNSAQNNECLILVQNGIVLHSSTRCECTYCNRKIPSLKHVQQHVKGKMHIKHLCESIQDTTQTTYFCKDNINETHSNDNSAKVTGMYNVMKHVCDESYKETNVITNKDKDKDKDKNIIHISQPIKKTNGLGKSTSGITKLSKKNHSSINSKLVMCNDDKINPLKDQSKKTEKKFKDGIYCHICNKIFKDQGHLNSKEHLRCEDALRHAIFLEYLKTDSPILQSTTESIPESTSMEKDNCNVMYYCDACNINVNKDDLFAHINKVLHTIHVDLAIKKLSKEPHNIKKMHRNILFNCSACKSIIEGNELFLDHIFQPKHVDSMMGIIKKTQCSVEDYNKISCKCNATRCTFLQTDNAFHVLFYVILFNDVNASKQITKEPFLYFHTDQLIHLIKGTTKDINIQRNWRYMCSVCVQQIDGNLNLIRHILERNHENALKMLSSTETVHITKLEKCNVKEISETSATCMNQQTVKFKCPERKKCRNVDNSENELLQICENVKELSMKAESSCDFFMPNSVHNEMQISIETITSSKNRNNNEQKFLWPHEKQEKDNSNRYNIQYSEKHLQIEQIMFACNNEKLRIIECSSDLSYVSGTNRVCLVCTEKLPNDLYIFLDHLRTIKHINNFKNLQIDFYNFGLTMELIKQVSETHVICYSCNICIKQDSKLIEQHINQNTHKQNRKQIYIKFNDITKIIPELENCWYNIQKYSCVPCNKRFDLKYDFVEHICKTYHSTQHVYDFCIPCATLWLGSFDTYEAHCTNQMHKYFVNNKNLIIGHLPMKIEEMLKKCEQFAIELLDQSKQTVTEYLKCSTVETSLKSTLKQVFPNMTVYPFGSRISGLCSPESDIDIFIDCVGNMYYNGDKSSLDYLRKAEKSFSNEEKTWRVEEVIYNATVPIIKLWHTQTQLYCDLSFTNGLSVESTKLLRSYNDACSDCRKLILFLKKWLSMCNLPGIHPITNFALAWLVIFYLQIQFLVPNVVDSMKIKSLLDLPATHQSILDWPIASNYYIHPITIKQPFSLLLLGFFDFYAKFDYRYNVICPLIGTTVKRQNFAIIENLPKEMAPYLFHVKTSKNPQYFRIDSAMCLQDPLILSRNITRAISPVTLKCFKQYCSDSAYILRKC